MEYGIREFDILFLSNVLSDLGSLMLDAYAYRIDAIGRGF